MPMNHFIGLLNKYRTTSLLNSTFYNKFMNPSSRTSIYTGQHQNPGNITMNILAIG